MDHIDNIAQYLQQNTRNKIVFCREHIEGLKFIDIGHELSLIIGIPNGLICGYETAYKQIFNQGFYDDTLGPYLAIENIGILFEPEMRLDLRSVIDTYSRDICLIIKSDAIIQNNILHFLSPGDDAKIDLQGLSYTIL